MRVERPASKKQQESLYSGKKKAHSVKSIIVTGFKDRLVKYLGKIAHGRIHDKTLLEAEELVFPDGSYLLGDLAFMGHKPNGATMILQYKKPKGKQLDQLQKDFNRVFSGIRVRVEHVISGIKRLRILKDVARRFRKARHDMVMEIACGLHNLRTIFRNQQEVNHARDTF